jgi:hypothetical protein
MVGGDLVGFVGVVFGLVDYLDRRRMPSWRWLGG